MNTAVGLCRVCLLLVFALLPGCSGNGDGDDQDAADAPDLYCGPWPTGRGNYLRNGRIASI